MHCCEQGGEFCGLRGYGWFCREGGSGGFVCVVVVVVGGGFIIVVVTGVGRSDAVSGGCEEW